MASQAPSDYSWVLATVGLAALEREAVELADVLMADGARAQASRVRQAYLRLLEELEAIAVRIAAQAQDDIIEARRQGQVRPDTGGAGGPQLDDYIGHSTPLAAVEGSVAINNEAFLDSSPAYWWRAIDQGYDWSGHQDVTIRGFFEPGHARPSLAEAGVHPLFQAAGRGPIMTPANDILPQEFVNRGYRKTEADWHTLVQAAKRRFMREAMAAMGAAPRRQRP